MARSVTTMLMFDGDAEVNDDATVQIQTPGNWDVIVLEHNPMEAGKAGGVLHFGFRLKRAEDIDAAVAAVEAAGGRVERTGEFVPGEPYVFAADPDGYEVELWYELPTPMDPPSRPSTDLTRSPIQDQ